MKITRVQACQILGVSEGASLEEIRSSYKHLARKWHPDKQDGSIGDEEATKKFQEVSAAYKKLTTNERDYDEDSMTLAEMMELYRQFFSFGNNAMGQCNCRNHPPSYYRYNEEISDYDDYDYTEDEDSDDEFWESITSRLRNKFEARKYMQKDMAEIPRSKITEEEALKNAQELIEEEEIEKRKKEKKKAKKKKKKEKRKHKEKNQKFEKENYDKNYTDEKTEYSEEKNETLMSNGHVIKDNSINTQNKSSNKRMDKGFAEKFDTPLKRIIVQEDIRQCISNENKPGKRNKLKHDLRPSMNGKDSSDGEDQFDASSAFFARAASKAPTIQVTPQNSHLKDEIQNDRKKDMQKNNSPQKPKEIKKSATVLKDRKEEDKNLCTENNDNKLENGKNGINTKQETNLLVDDIIIKSRQLAVKGNDLASKEQYYEAINMFTEAIKLDPTDFRFFGNRSYCYDRTRQYESALKDAESAIQLAVQWPKGYFRKGRAFTGLKRYQEAEAAFQTVLKLDADCPDAQFELVKVRVRILTDMGFDIQLAEDSVRKNGTVQSALEALLSGNVTQRSDTEDFNNSADVHDGKTNIDSSPRSEKQTIIVTTQNKSKSYSNCTALWVGNVCSQNVSEKQLTQLFSKCGKLASVRLLPEKYCAFVNYQSPESASLALEKLQGVEIGGQNLLIRYPNNPPPGSSVLPEKNNGTSHISKKGVDKSSLSKVTGPVNGNECYFWRTTGCVFENHCRYLHVNENKGVDLAKVHAKYGHLL